MEDGCPKRGPPPSTNIIPQKVGGCPQWGGPLVLWRPMRGLPPKGGPPSNIALHHLWGLPPTMGGPPTSFHQLGGCPPKGAPPKQLPTKRGILSPLREHGVFRARSLRKNSGRSQNISGTLQKIPDAFRNFSGLMVYSETIFGFSETLPVFSPKHFQCLRNFSGDFLSDSFPSTQQIDDP